jgi:scyllo-inositol 2-dehydrogenase (NADP+)
MSSAPIRTAVIGYGLAGRVFHCPFVAAVPGLELSAIVVRAADKAAAAHATYPSARIIATLDEALADPTIDLIVVGTPNDSHVAIATAALNSGKHVVVDKPMAPSSAEARALIDLSIKVGKVLAPFHNRRYDGDFLTVKKLIHDGTLGRVTQVLSHYDRFRPIQRPNSWKEAAGPASGNLFDLGPHLVDQAIALFGTPLAVTASVRFDRDHTDIDDAADIVFDYKIAHAVGEQPRTLRYECHESMLAADPAPRFRVHGTHATYTPILGSPEEAKSPWLPEAPAAWGTLTLATKRTEPVEYERSKYPTVTGDYRLFYAQVRDAIQGIAPLAIPAEDAFRTIRLLELALQSSHEQRTIPVDFV